jgi:hypothetical protein
MNNPNYSSDNPNLARSNADANNSANSNPANDETQTLRWDSTWQPDLDEDYGTPVQQYSGPGAFPPLPSPSAPPQHPYAQAAQNVPVQGYPGAPTYANQPIQPGYYSSPSYANPPMQGYSTPPPPTSDVPNSPYAPVQVYVGDQPAATYTPAPLQDNQAYKGYVPPAQGYNGQPISPQSRSTRAASGWIVALIVFFVVMAVLGSWGWWSFWPFWVFIFWPFWAFGGRGYGRRRRNRNRW